jgi:hypothetical protein
MGAVGGSMMGSMAHSDEDRENLCLLSPELLTHIEGKFSSEGVNPK